MGTAALQARPQVAAASVLHGDITKGDMMSFRPLVTLAAMAATLNIVGCAGMSEGTAEADVRAMPQFEVDPAWPKVPPKWRLGDASSIAIDAQDNVYVLHRPRALKGPALSM